MSAAGSGDYTEYQKAIDRFRKYADKLTRGGEAGYRHLGMRSAYMEFLKQLEKRGPESIDRLIKHVMYEKGRYFAQRIVRTELAAQYADEFLREANADPNVTAIRWMLSEKHPVRDICDTYAAQNLFGLGKGVYPKGKVPRLPAHPHCLSEDTEVYTESGWLKFNELNGEAIYALNPETLEADYCRYTKLIAWRHDGPMLRFHTKHNDFLVTTEHRMFVGRRRQVNGTRRVVWGIEPADGVTGEYKLYKGQHYDGGAATVSLFGQTMDGKVYARFMAFYLGDGCVTYRGGKRYQIIIATTKQEVLSRIERDGPALGVKVNRHDNGVSIYDAAWGAYLHQLGHAHEKYMPAEIKSLNRGCLREFLDSYVLCDGSVRPPKAFKDGKYSQSRAYYTTSKRLADDFTEVLLKAGKSVSYKLQRAAKGCKFPNGHYDGIHDCWIISELNKVVIGNKMRRDVVPYSGMVYDVELEKWHVLLVRRNGKIFWTGNCLCHYQQVTRPVKEQIRALKEQYQREGRAWYAPIPAQAASLFANVPTRGGLRGLLDEALGQTEGDIHAAVEKYAPSVQKFKFGPGNYSKDTRIMKVGKTTASREKQVWTTRHEFGHHVDHMARGANLHYRSQSADFTDAMRLDGRELMRAGSPLGQEAKDKLIKLPTLRGIYRWNACISDLIGAVTLNGIVGDWKHEVSYYRARSGYGRQTQAFANLFAIYAKAESTEISFIERVLPNLTRVFKEILRTVI